MQRTIRSVSRVTATALLLSLGVAGTYIGFSHLAEKPAIAAPAASAPLELKKGDHIAIVGGVIADRMQHEGSLEAMLYAKYPNHDLVVRNLAVSGDEVTNRHRSENFGTPDEWLAKTQADVIFAFFGATESFKGEAGLQQFKADLDKWVKETQKKNYSGKASPRIVLFSPAAQEKHPDPNLPDPTRNNKNLQSYAAAVAEVAKANNVLFVDLFGPSQQLFADAAKAGKPLTVNGLYLTDEGNRRLAGVIYSALAGETSPTSDLSKLQAAVNEKNAQWHARYRTVDGYNVYGGRSKLAFPSGKPGEKITNFDVMQQEMTQRDALTANRDKVVWAAAQGKTIQPDDSNLPPVSQVPPNKPAPGPDGTPVYLSGEEAIKKMTLAPGLKINLFASEKEFPELVNGVQMAFDQKGRLWVAAWRTYPERTPTDKIGDSILIFEDTDGDGKADKCTHFMDGLNCPTGFQFYKDGILLMQAPDLWYVRDTNGDGKADGMERILMGMDSADSHHTTNAMCYEPGGAVYLSDGVFHRTQVETAYGTVRNNDGAIYRFEPRTGKFETHVAYGFANPHGRVFDAWGNDIITDATGNATYFGPAFSGRIDYPKKHAGMKQLWDRPSRPCPSTGILTSKHFPEEFWNNFLNLNVIGFQGIYRVKQQWEGSGIQGTRLPDLISSTDPNFRPIAIATGPDGALYMSDWQQFLIGHMQHHIRDPNRDHAHGRIYRITADGRPLNKAPKIAGEPIPAVLEYLKDAQDHVREWARLELDRHDAKEVIPAVRAWIKSLDPKDPNYQHHLTEALWQHQWHNVVDAQSIDFLKTMLKSPEPQARAAATRVLCYWRDRVPEAVALLKTAAGDEDPRVRLQAVRAASFFDTADAIEIPLELLKHPTDYYLDYTKAETLKQLEPVWQKALAEGKLNSLNSTSLKELLKSATIADLTKLPPSPGIMEVILTRPDAMDAERNAALQSLSEAKKQSRVEILLGLIESSKNDPQIGATLARMLPMHPGSMLKPYRQKLETLAATQGGAKVQSSAWGAVMLADDSADAVWAQASKDNNTLADLLSGIPSIYSPDVRAKAYDKVMPLLTDKKTPANVRRAAIAAAVSIGNEPAKVAAALSDLIKSDQQVSDAARGLRALPRASYAKDQAGPIVDGLIAWAKKVPEGKRTAQEYVETVQFATDLSGALPADKSAAARKELKGLRVAVFVITTVREQMRYDTTRLVVEAGKPVEIIFENTDFMPHNLVVVNPGKREQVGTKTATMRPDQLDKQGRAFVPNDKEVLAGTKLIEAGQKVVLKFTAPEKEGVYEYVCTFPGHWENMWGKLVVTKDVDSYLEKNPDAGTPAAAAGHEHKH